MTEFQAESSSPPPENAAALSRPAAPAATPALRHAQNPRGSLLREVLVKTKKDRALLLVGQAFDGLPQGDALDDLLLDALAAEEVLERSPALAVSACSDDVGAAARSAAAMSSAVRPVSPASSDRVGSRPRAWHSAPRAAQERAALLDGTADLDRPSSRRKRRISPAILAPHRWKTGCPAPDRTAHGLEKAEAAELVEVLAVHTPAEVAPRNAPDESAVFAQHARAGSSSPSRAACRREFRSAIIFP
jgi:hypothetical protein